MQEIRVIELYAGAKKCCTLYPEEIKDVFHGSDVYFVERDWQVSCEYLTQFTEDDGVCRLDLQQELDGNTLDYAKTMAVFMLAAGLQNSQELRKIPYAVTMRVMPYISARQAMAQIQLTRCKRLDDAVIRGLRALRSFDGSSSVDEVFSGILDDLPAVGSFAIVEDPDKGRYLPFFEMLAEKAEACADPEIAERIGEYLDVLQ